MSENGSKMTTVENKIHRLNVSMSQELDQFTSQLETIHQEELALEKDVEKLEKLEEMLEELGEEGATKQDMEKIVEIVNEDQEVFEKLDNARKEAEAITERIEEIEKKAERVMDELGGLSPKRSISV